MVPTRAWAVAALLLAGLVAASAAAQVPTPFRLGASPVPAQGTFTNGRGGCPLATSFTDRFEFHAPGDGTLTITQPSTGDRVSGPISPDGTFALRSAGESYSGRITGSRAAATYTYTMTVGCTQTYDASFELAIPESDLELRILAPGRARLAGSPRPEAFIRYRIAVENGGPSTSPSAQVTLRVSRPVAVRLYSWERAAGYAEDKPMYCSARGGSTVVIRCRVPELHRGEDAGVVVSVRVGRPAAYVARGTVTGSNADPVLANNRATRRTTVRR